MTTTDFPQGQVTADDVHEELAPGDPNFHSGQTRVATHRMPAGVEPNIPVGQVFLDAHSAAADGDPNLTGSQVGTDTQRAAAPGDPNSLGGQMPSDAQCGDAAEGSHFPAGHARSDAHVQYASGDLNSDGGQHAVDTHAARAPVGPLLDDPALTLLADRLDDIERLRIAQENQYRQLTRTEVDKDGGMRGMGLSPDLPVAQRFLDGIRALKCEKKAAPLSERGGYGCCQEHRAEADLVIQLREHPLYEFQQRYRGLGMKQFARLLGTVGDPYWHTLENRPRTVSELWAYCGLHVSDSQAVRRAKGQRANWSTLAKTRGFLCAEAMMKAGRPEDGSRGEFDPIADYFRKVYDDYKTAHTGSLHPAECKRCGPSGKPAQPGSVRSAGHVHAMALRKAEKELLKELLRASREVYER